MTEISYDDPDAGAPEVHDEVVGVVLSHRLPRPWEQAFRKFMAHIQ